MDDIYWTNYYIETILRNVREDEERKIWHNNQEVKNSDKSILNDDVDNDTIEFTWNGTNYVHKEEIKEDKL